MTINPLADLVLIKVDPVKKQTSSGLYVQQEWKSLPPTGAIQAIGPDVTKVKVGEKVLFDRYASIILEDDLRLAKESHCHATV